MATDFMNGHDPVALNDHSLHPSDLFRLARTQHKAGCLERAEQLYCQLLRVAPQHPQTLHFLGVVYFQQQRYEQAEKLIRQALSLQADSPSLYNNLGSVLCAVGRLAEAEEAFDQALEIKGEYPGALANLAGVLVQQQRLKEAVHCYERSLALEPGNGQIHFELGNILRRQGKLSQAVKSFRAASRAEPEMAAAQANLGATLLFLGRLEEAVPCLRRALVLDPELVEPRFNLGDALATLDRPGEARMVFESVLGDTESPLAAAIYCHFISLILKTADWSNYDFHRNELIRRVKQHVKEEGGAAIPLLTLNLLPTPIALRVEAARQDAMAVEKMVAADRLRCGFTHGTPSAGKIRLGYLSPDFRGHVVGHLVREMFALHNRDDFEVHCYSLYEAKGPADQVRRGIQAGCDRYCDVSEMSPRVAAQRIHGDKIDILIDLAGHTTFSKPAVLAMRPAPVQAHWLGYPETMGADFLPYIIADPFVITPQAAALYPESIVYLPECCMVSSHQPISGREMKRAEFGLPEDGFVYCCFNRIQKIDPEVFAARMQIMQKVPRSVLWLFDEGGQTSKDNLRRSARSAGVGPERLVFAHRLPQAEYLARYQLADLFLDTFAYNGCGTAVSALWAGLPLLTRPGESFLSRMGGSLNRAVGLEELICPDTRSYIDKAVQMGLNPEKTAQLRRDFVRRRTQAPLFNTPRFVAHLEQGFRMMWKDYLTSVPPRHIHVPLSS